MNLVHQANSQNPGKLIFPFHVANIFDYRDRFLPHSPKLFSPLYFRGLTLISSIAFNYLFVFYLSPKQIIENFESIVTRIRDLEVRNSAGNNRK